MSKSIVPIPLPSREKLEDYAAKGYGATSIAEFEGIKRWRIEYEMQRLGIKADMPMSQRRIHSVPIGEKFGRLIVMGLDGYRRQNDGFMRAFWKCKCDCGAECVRGAAQIKNGQTRSCGCLKIEMTVARTRNRPSPIRLSSGRAHRNATLCGYLMNAKSRALEWKLSDSEFDGLLAGNCFYCDSPPSNILHGKPKVRFGDFTYNGIDRLNSSIGYEPSNCVSCCWTCNRAKGKRLTAEAFISLARRIADKHPTAPG